MKYIKKDSDKLIQKFADFKSDCGGIKVKVEAFNIYDLFKDEGGNG